MKPGVRRKGLMGLYAQLEAEPGEKLGEWVLVRPLGLRGGVQFWVMRCSCGKEAERPLAWSRHHAAKGLATRCASCAQAARWAKKAGSP